jgi:hypothetical protein
LYEESDEMEESEEEKEIKENVENNKQDNSQDDFIENEQSKLEELFALWVKIRKS